MKSENANELNKQFNTVFSRPVRILNRDEMLVTGGGYKRTGGVDNQTRDYWNSTI